MSLITLMPRLHFSCIIFSVNNMGPPLQLLPAAAVLLPFHLTPSWFLCQFFGVGENKKTSAGFVGIKFPGTFEIGNFIFIQPTPIRHWDKYETCQLFRRLKMKRAYKLTPLRFFSPAFRAYKTQRVWKKKVFVHLALEYVNFLALPACFLVKMVHFVGLHYERTLLNNCVTNKHWPYHFCILSTFRMPLSLAFSPFFIQKKPP